MQDPASSSGDFQEAPSCPSKQLILYWVQASALPLRARLTARTVSNNFCARPRVDSVLSSSWPARPWTPVACGYSFLQLWCLWVHN